MDAKFFDLLRDPAKRDPRGYVLPADQADFLTATKFINVLLKNGIAVQRATAAFTVSGTSYPAGSFVVKTAQAFRPFVLDMFEPQDHPNDFQYPGGPPIPPYDNAGWTVAYQMGIKFDRILEGFDGPFEKVTGLVTPAPGQVTEAGGAAGYTFSHAQNDAFIAVNRLLKNGDEVYWLKSGPGTMYVTARPQTLPVLKKAATDLGITFTAASARPDGDAIKLRPVRIGLGDRYGGSMPSGWVRLILERYEFPFEQVFPQTLDAGNLRAKYDVLIFTDGGIPESDTRRGGGGGGGGGGFGGPVAPESIPAEYRANVGNVTVAKTVPQIKAFLEQGGTVLTIGSSTSLASHLKLPITDALVERTANGGMRTLPQDKFYVPGSVLEVAVDPTHPLAYGMGPRADVLFDHSPSFRLLPDAALKGVRPVAWFATRQAAAQRLGLGPVLPPGQHRRGGSPGRQGPPVHLRPGNHLPRPAPRHLQTPLQRHLLRPRHERRHARVLPDGGAVVSRKNKSAEARLLRRLQRFQFLNFRFSASATRRPRPRVA